MGSGSGPGVSDLSTSSGVDEPEGVTGYVPVDTGGASASGINDPMPPNTAVLEIMNLQEIIIGELDPSLDSVDIAEVFCPGRFEEWASAFGLMTGPVFDLRCGWDLNNKHQTHELKNTKTRSINKT